MKMAPTLSAIRLILSQSHSLEYADAPPMISFGLRLVFQSFLFHVVIVDETGDFVQAVGYGMIQDARHVYRRTVSEVSSVSQIESHERVSRFQACHHYGHVCLGSGMRLYVCIFSTEQLAEPVYGELFYLVYDFTPSVIPGSRISFCVFVRADRT